ncbi:uncharacterized protein LOC778318 precursor [Solanum lycopersicum]|uniref:Uncharacterized protein n=1 Tax=Solanum lycopersicum TaxID=4081 RepID=Q53U39_SOLLC|nr:uncharacterized protein LOC778318 precursor [Solanum lycopersicum]BAD95793.1 hypothetical protein [Solanum lycopersicum]
MAKLFFAVLFLFFNLSLARTPFTQPENDVTHLKLPSENDLAIPELPHTLPESDDSAPAVNIPSKSDHENTRSVHSVPVTLVRFRPINRRFRLRSRLPFRLCHHLKPGSQRQIPYGNDMILPSKRNIDFDKFLNRIGVRQIPSDPFSFRHHRYNDKKIWKFLYDRENFGEMKLKDQLPHHDENEDNDHEQRQISISSENQGNFGEIKSKNENEFHAHDESDKRSKLYVKHYEMNLRKRFHYNNGEEGEKAKEENKWHKREKKKGGFMRGIRKFLHHYFD